MNEVYYGIVKNGMFLGFSKNKESELDIEITLDYKNELLKKQSEGFEIIAINGNLIAVGVKEKINYIKPIFNTEKNTWVETATQSEMDWLIVNKQYNEYMQLANTYDTELMKEEGVWENFRTFIDECRVYLTRIKKGIEVRSSIPMPSKNLEKFFENSFKEVDKNV